MKDSRDWSRLTGKLLQDVTAKGIMTNNILLYHQNPFRADVEGGRGWESGDYRQLPPLFPLSMMKHFKSAAAHSARRSVSAAVAISMIDILRDPEEYFAVSILSLVLFSWNYLYLPDESLGNVILFLVTCNFFLSFLHLSFSCTCWFFFGEKSTKQYQMNVFELILTFLMSKIVILELASQESVMDGWHWTLWLVVVAWTKGLIYQANFYVYYVSQCGESHSIQYILSFFHIVPTLFCFHFLIKVADLWTLNSATQSLKNLLWYDILYLIVESSLVICKFVLLTADDNQSFTQLSSSIQPVLEICFELILTALSLFHLIHIITINGISVTLVGVATILNFYSVITKMWRLVLQLREFFRIKRKVELLFPSILSKEISNLEHFICPICLQGHQPQIGLKQLPCSHTMHENCLRILLQNQRTSITHEELTSISDPKLMEYLSRVRLFRCPICRQRINSDTAEILPSSRYQDLKSLETDLHSGIGQPLMERNSRMVSNPTLWSLLESTLLYFGGATLHHPTATPRHIYYQSTLQSEADVILEMFPQFPRDMILRDLSRTTSSAETIENILSGRIQIFQEQNDSNST